jgi:hypothetical protein
MIDKTEEEYQELEMLGRRLGIPVPSTHLQIQSYAMDGELLSEYKDRSHSYNRNFYNRLFLNLTRANYYPNIGAHSYHTNDPSHHDDGGNLNLQYGPGWLTWTYLAETNWWNSTTRIIESNYWDYINIGAVNLRIGQETGIAVGSGADPESFEGYMLSDPIRHGTNPAAHVYGPDSIGRRLYYGKMIDPRVTFDGSTWTGYVGRAFMNFSPNDVTVNEVGLYVYHGTTYLGVMIARDVITDPIIQPHGFLIVTYVISLTYPPVERHEVIIV